MPQLSSFTLPVKDTTTGQVSQQTFTLPSGGGGGGASNPEALGIGYGTCSTAYATSAKTATLSNYVKKTNGTVSIKFTNAVNANATLNINNEGAYPIYYRGEAISNYVINQGDTATFFFDGSYYHLTSVDNIFEATVVLTGTRNGSVRVQNTSAGIDTTVVLNSQGFGSYTCKQPGTYVFTLS